MTCHVWFLVLGTATPSIEERVVDFVSEEVLPDLQVLPVTFETQRYLWEKLLLVREEVEDVPIEELLE